MLILGDSARVLQGFDAHSVDMVYADPPFGNEQIWSGKAGSFSDKWSWSEASAQGWEKLRLHSAVGADLLSAVATRAPARAYLGCMACMLLAVHHVLAKTGTLWLHFDDTMGAELRILGDVIFGPDNQIGTVIWKRTTSHSSARSFGRVHDTIACFGRTRAARARLDRIGDRELVHRAYDQPAVVDGLLLDDLMHSGSAERIGYPTQKPLSLISRFIRAASLPNGLVLDPCCGSGTTLVAAKQLGRRFIGIDLSEDALSVARTRLTPPREQFSLFGAAA